VLEQQFAATPRGAALVTRIKADPGLATTELRIISKDADGAAPKAGATGRPGSLGGWRGATAVSATARRPVARHARTDGPQRIPDCAGVEAVVDGPHGHACECLDVGAQVCYRRRVLTPNQRVRVVILG
jgi:hypothetical protein